MERPKNKDCLEKRPNSNMFKVPPFILDIVNLLSSLTCIASIIFNVRSYNFNANMDQG